MPPDPPPPAPSRQVRACGFTHPGRQREENEDALGLFVEERLFVVADGMGGRTSGDVAAHLTVDELARFFREQRANPRAPWPFELDKSTSLGANLLRVGLKVANQRIREAAAEDPSRHRMGATAAAIAIGETQIVAANVGDVRVYRLRGGALARMTRDHSVLEEMRAARPDMSPEQLATVAHRNVVTRALGTKEDVEPSVHADGLEPGDVYLMCSDGLWGSVADAQIEAMLCAHTELESACQALIDAANEAGGPDNVTALLALVE